MASKEKIDELISEIKISPRNLDEKAIGSALTSLIDDIHDLNSMDLDNLDPMDYLDETPIDYLREDVVDHKSQKEVILKNASRKDKDYVIIERVIK